MTFCSPIALTKKQFKIVETYEELKLSADGDPIKRKVAVQLGYTIDVRTNSNSFVNDVIKMWIESEKTRKQKIEITKVS